MSDFGEPTKGLSVADAAVDYMLRRLRADPRIAYYFVGTESLRALTRAYAAAHGLDADAFHAEFAGGLETERPVCRECREAF